MNGEVTFTRTMRALDADNFHLSQAGLLAAAALLSSWAWWMLGARVKVHEDSGSLKLQSPASIALGAAGAPNR